MMMVRLLDFSNKVTESFEKFDLKQVYEMTQAFIVKEVSEFYLDFSKFRRRRINSAMTLTDGTTSTTLPDTVSQSDSTLAVLYHTMNTLLLTAAPIICLTS